MFQRKSWLLTAALCAVIAAMLVVPASAHGHHGGGHGGCHGYYAQSYAQSNVQAVQPSQAVPNGADAVCPYGDCAIYGYHYHDGTAYCGYGHAYGYCSGSVYGHHGCW